MCSGELQRTRWRFRARQAPPQRVQPLQVTKIRKMNYFRGYRGIHTCFASCVRVGPVTIDSPDMWKVHCQERC